jgi:hypothetical protein
MIQEERKRRVNSGTACYCLLLFGTEPFVLSAVKNIKIRMYKTIILPAAVKHGL